MKAMFVLLMVTGISSAYAFLDQPWDMNHDQTLQIMKYAEDFVACDGSLQEVDVWRESNAPCNVTVELWSDGADGPSNLLQSTTVSVTWQPFSSVYKGSITLPGWGVQWGQTYWMAVAVAGGDQLGAPDTYYPDWGECYQYNGGWEEVPEVVFMVIEGTPEGSALESSTWGAIKAVW